MTTTRGRFADRRASDIKPGNMTLDGIVLDVETSKDGMVIIRHRNVTYVQEPDSTVQIFGTVPRDVTEHIRQAVGIIS